MRKNYLPIHNIQKNLWLLVFFAVLLTGRNTMAQTTLVAGDIAFTGVNSNASTVLANEFSFVILRTGGISAGTVINFTDYGWNTKLTPPALGPNAEGVITWTATAALPQFTEVMINVSSTGTSFESIPPNSSVTITGTFNLSQAGDQVLAFQGTLASPTFISGIHYNANIGDANSMPTTEAGWDNLTGGTIPYNFNSNSSAIPPGLTNGVNAIFIASGTAAPFTEIDNGVYNCTGSTGATLTDIRAAINNRANWNMQNSTAYTLPSGCTFAIGAAPSITGQPSNSTICAGGNTTFTVTAANATGYQWQVDQGSGFTNLTNGGVYSGATTATLAITGATAALNGYLYRVVVSGTIAPPATSNAATLTVNNAPSITTSPAQSTVCAGANTGFTVSASNATGYQWQVNEGFGYMNITNSSLYSGATTATLSITGATADLNGYQYRVVASGTCSPDATSAAATLTVNSAPSITTQPLNSTVCPDANTAFSVAASDATSYQWQVDEGAGFTNLSNGAPYSGVTTSILSISGATAALSGNQYRVVITGACTPNAVSNNVTLVSEDNTDPVIAGCPSNVTLTASAGTCAAVAVWTAPTATDNCSTASLTANFNSGASFPVGVTQVVYTATDDAGNESTCSFNVTVTDTEDPVFTSCPSDVTIETGVYTYTAPAASDNCSGVTVAQTSGLGSGAVFPIGETVETYVATDQSGNTQTCSFTVTATSITGINDKWESSWKIYPNPASDHIFIESSVNTMTNMTMQITDYTGRVIIQSEITFMNNQVTLPVGNLPKGMYHIHLTGENKHLVKMIRLN